MRTLSYVASRVQCAFVSGSLPRRLLTSCCIQFDFMSYECASSPLLPGV